MPKYEIASFDVCMPGFERMRSASEFILVASVQYGMSKDDLIGAFNDDLQSCMRPDDFDYGGAREVVRAYVNGLDMAQVLQYIDAPKDPEADIDIVEELEGCNAYLYIRTLDAEDEG